MTNIDQQIKGELSVLIKEGWDILVTETEEKSRKVKKEKQGDTQEPLPTIIRYQSWYTKAFPVVRHCSSTLAALGKRLHREFYR